jgi:hypothetical protein
MPFSIIRVTKDGADHSGHVAEGMKCLHPLKTLELSVGISLKP